MFCWLKWAHIPGFLIGSVFSLVLGVTRQPLANGGQDNTIRPERARVTFTHALPRLDGSKLRVTIVEVNYGPGESSRPHTHPCPVVGYVLEGALRTQVAGEAAAVYGPGDSFYEAPHGVHLVSANASDKSRAKFLAFFVCDKEAPLSAPVDTSRKEANHD
ncbi:MAG TPA: cupin domain-containing protein [Verrucomicrobiae bacterium]|nr:cupin domain-containing protein [Verrucomicrobiae bacterium]